MPGIASPKTDLRILGPGEPGDAPRAPGRGGLLSACRARPPGIRRLSVEEIREAAEAKLNALTLLDGELRERPHPRSTSTPYGPTAFSRCRFQAELIEQCLDLSPDVGHDGPDTAVITARSARCREVDPRRSPRVRGHQLQAHRRPQVRAHAIASPFLARCLAQSRGPPASRPDAGLPAARRSTSAC